MDLPHPILIVGRDENGLRLDRLLLRHVQDMTRPKARLLLDANRLRVNGEPPAALAAELASGDRVEILPAARTEDDARLLFDDPHLVVLVKPAGHPVPRRLMRGSRGRPAARTLLGLERAQSGVVVATRTAQAFHDLAHQINSGDASRRYTAVVHGGHAITGGPPRDAGGWEVSTVTRYRQHTLLHLRPPRPDADPLEALRRHGLTPVRLPGPETGLAVHADRVILTHPRSRRRMRFAAPLPGPFRRLLDSLEPAPTLAADVPATPPHGPRTQEQEEPAEREPALRSPRDILRREHRGPRRG